MGDVTSLSLSVSNTAKLDATGHRSLAALSTFNFDIKYRPGKNNADADALSRLPAVHDSEGCTLITLFMPSCSW
jgi:hypothetical protein